MKITANKITMLRIFLLPIPIYMLVYGEIASWWVAFFLFTLLGATDFVDGMMARREGPTVLGSLIDPVADKIFVAAIMLCLAAINVFDIWMASAVLFREFLLTALRSSVAKRDHSIKTSILGKMKTIIQMGGCGTIFLTIVLPPTGIFWANLALSLGFLAVAIVYFIKGKKKPFWAIPVFLCFVLVALLGISVDKQISILVQISIIITLTWISAIDYILGSFKLFQQTKLFCGDFYRLLWCFIYGIMLILSITSHPSLVIPLLISISLEFGIAGIDNIILTKNNKFVNWPFIASCSYGLLSFAMLYFNNSQAHLYSWLLVLFSSLNVLTFFLINKNIFTGKASEAMLD